MGADLQAPGPVGELKPFDKLIYYIGTLNPNQSFEERTDIWRRIAPLITTVNHSVLDIIREMKDSEIFTGSDRNAITSTIKAKELLVNDVTMTGIETGVARLGEVMDLSLIHI